MSTKTTTDNADRIEQVRRALPDPARIAVELDYFEDPDFFGKIDAIEDVFENVPSYYEIPDGEQPVFRLLAALRHNAGVSIKKTHLMVALLEQHYEIVFSSVEYFEVRDFPTEQLAADLEYWRRQSEELKFSSLAALAALAAPPSRQIPSDVPAGKLSAPTQPAAVAVAPGASLIERLAKMAGGQKATDSA